MSTRPAYTQHALNGGELSKRFEARQDQNKYQSGVAKGENWLPIVVGGLLRRFGSVFVAVTKFGADKISVLIRFVFNSEQAYMLEFGHFYVRFYKDGAQMMNGAVPLELVTPYPDTMLRHIKMSAYQSADVMYIPSDGTLPMYKLRRIDNNPDTFDLAAVNFKSPGTKESEMTGTELNGGTLTPGATSGDDVVFTASGTPFLAGDVGMTIKGPDAALAIINTFTSSSSVIADIIDPFTDLTPIPADDWSLSGTPSANINPSKAKKGGNIEITADVDAFRAAYVGRYILLYGGLVEITKFKTVRKVFGIIRSDLIDRDKVNPSATGFWSLEEDAWTDEDGYPTAGCFYQERMIVARNQTRWASNTGEFENFAKGSDDSAGFARVISDDEVNDILWLKGSLNGLFTATQGGMYQAQASTEKGPLTPNDFNEAPVSALGAEAIAPNRIEGVLVYVHDGGRAVIEQAFNFVDNKFDSPNLLARSDHLTEFNTIIATGYQKRPHSLLWCVRDDGKLLALAYLRKEDVVAWAPQVTDGEFQDICVIPRPEIAEDWPWVIVDRVINGVVRRYIEYFESFNTALCREWRSAQTDSAVFTQADDNFIISGLDHLEAKTVWVIGGGMLFNATSGTDGKVRSTAVVTGGQITIKPQISGIVDFEVGLDFISDGLTLEPIVPNELGGPLMARGWEAAAARVRRTLGLTINGEQIPFRQAQDAMDGPIPLKRGKVVVVVQACDGEGRINFVQNLPFPAEILNIMGRVSIGDEPYPFLIGDEPDIDCLPPPDPPPPPVPPVCNDSTERGQQELVFETYVSNLAAGGNTRTSWGYVSPTGEVYTLAGTGSCGGGNMPYADSCVRVNHYTDAVTLDHPALVGPNTFKPAVNLRPGQADEPMYSLGADVALNYVYPVRGLKITLDLQPGGAPVGGTIWAKRDTRIFVISEGGSNDLSNRLLLEYTDTGGAVLNTRSQTRDYNHNGLSMTADSVWSLCVERSTGRTKIVQFMRANGNVGSIIDIHNLPAVGIYVVHNSLIYILTNGATRSGLYYWNGSSIVSVGEGTSVGTLQMPLGMSFTEGVLYFGSRGANGSNPAIFRAIVECPPDAPIVATISAIGPVAAGASITVSWANVLVPHATDVISLRADDIGFAGPQFDSEAADGLGTSSKSFSIPPGVPPGTYVFQYIAQGQIVICQSAPFEII